MTHRLPVAVLACLAATVVFSAEPATQRWPAFQGAPLSLRDLPNAELPLHWSPTEHVAWKARLPGYGQSSPVVWDGRIYVTSISGAKKEHCHLCAFDLRTGARLWQYDVAAASQAENTNYVSKAAPSPIVDELGVTALFEGGNLIALDHEGRLRWERNLVEEYGPLDSRHGLASSLEQNLEHVFVWMERQEDPYLLAVAKTTGETIWKVPGLGATSWSSPRLVPVGDGAHLVLSGIGKLAGFDPGTGNRLWELEDISGNSTPTPIPLGNGRFLIGATEGRGEESGGGNAAASNGVVQIAAQSDGSFQATWVWRAAKATSSFGSPIAHQGFAYFVNRTGIVFCLDLSTGQEQYAKRSPGSVWATPIAAGNRIYLFGRDGKTAVLQAGPAFKILSENALWEDETNPPKTPDPAAGPAAVDGLVLYAVAAVESQLIFRRGDELYVVAP